MASIQDKRKKFMDHLLKVMNLLDPTGQNAKNYQEKFEKMSDSQFDKYIRSFFKDEKQNFYLEIVEYENQKKSFNCYGLRMYVVNNCSYNNCIYKRRT